LKNISLSQVAKILEVPVGCDSQVTGYQIDSRLVGEGELFFALKGAKSDGHDFLAEVRAKGAVGAVVSKGYQGPDFGLILLPVEDVVASLQNLARVLMQGCKARVVAITGSLGKTTTKEFTAALLGARFKVGKTPFNYNTKLTVPITLLNRKGDEEVLVLEMGMSEPGDLEKLISICPPDVAVLTTVALVHAAFFPRGILDIAEGKGQIFSSPRTQCAIFSHGLYDYPEVVSKICGKRISFSTTNRAADLFLSQELVDVCPFKEPHVLHNFLAAVAVAREMGLSWEEIYAKAPELRLPKMRLERIEKGGVLFINDAYNANPDSMKAALSCLPKPQNGGRRVAVLGRMVDLGPDSEKLHEAVGEFAAAHVDHLFVMGEEALPIYLAFQKQKQAELFVQFEAMAERLKAFLRPGDVVLVKASRVMQMETLFQWF
jgi:UDP-N-acetylmuramoyl-tripeptide--D-alanyl-D-alanine ligase